MKMKIKYQLTAPLSHIGETASTGTVFQTVNTSQGRVPVVTGNSIRGILRDKGAMHLLKSIDTAVDKVTFNLLFSGGNLAGASKPDVARAKAVREHFPLISLLGGGLGTMIMGGKMDCGFAYPICRETNEITGENADISWHSLIDEMEFTRTDDSKNDKLAKLITDLDTDVKKSGSASTQMRYSVQYLAPGTELTQSILFYDNVTDEEIGAFYTCVSEWFEHPKLGGMGNKGYGAFIGTLFDGTANELISVDNDGIKISENAKSAIEKYNQIEIYSKDYLNLIGGKDNGKT